MRVEEARGHFQVLFLQTSSRRQASIQHVVSAMEAEGRATRSQRSQGASCAAASSAPSLPSCMFSSAVACTPSASARGPSRARARGSGGVAREKPLQLVARRNARERRRVEAVNGAFGRLRRAVPISDARGKRVSKVKTLHRAIEYIQQLQRLLAMRQPMETAETNEDHSAHGGSQGHGRHEMIESPDRNKENSADVGNRWVTYDMSYRPASCAPDSLAQLLSEFQEF